MLIWRKNRVEMQLVVVWFSARLKKAYAERAAAGEATNKRRAADRIRSSGGMRMQRVWSSRSRCHKAAA